MGGMNIQQNVVLKVLYMINVNCKEIGQILMHFGS